MSGVGMSPGGGIIRLWIVDLDDPRDLPAPGEAVLSSGEWVRASQFLRQEDRQRWIRGRVSARCLLGPLADLSPSALPWPSERLEKPYLPGAGVPDFNISHSEGLFLLGVAAGAGDIGVDVEMLRPLPDLGGLAASILSPAELAVWEALPRRDRLRAFYRAWTLKEAALKCTGNGLSIEMRRVSLATADMPWSGAQSVFIDTKEYGGRHFAVHSFALHVGRSSATEAIGHIVHETPGVEVSVNRWP